MIKILLLFPVIWTALELWKLGLDDCMGALCFKKPEVFGEIGKKSTPG